MHRALSFVALAGACVEPYTLRRAPDDAAVDARPDAARDAARDAPRDAPRDVRAPPPPPPPPLVVTQLEAPPRDLDHLGRLPRLTLRFERPVAWPHDDALLLVTAPLTDALRADAWDGALAASLASRRVAVRLALAPGDPSVLTVEAREPLLPDTPLALLATSRLVGVDGATLPRDPRTLAWAGRVTSARRAGALGEVLSVAAGAWPPATTRVWLRFDRPVRGVTGEQPLALATERGETVPSRSALECLDEGALARCAWIEPRVTLASDTAYRVVPGALRGRNDVPLEAVLGGVTTGPSRDAPRVIFGAPLPCASDERSIGSFCLRTIRRGFELRAATVGDAIVRAVATPVGAPVAARSALGAPGRNHFVRIRSISPGVTYRFSVEALSADGRVSDAWWFGPVPSAPDRGVVRIGEVLSRPHGAASQEFVELVNDGPSPADLTGWSIAVGASRAAFPAGSVLAVGRRALAVGRAYDPRGDVRVGDPPTAPGAALFVVGTSLGGRGLRDDGADVALLDPDGVVVSRCPAGHPQLTPRPGVGLVRGDTELDDDDPAAWAWDALDGATPGAPDRLR